MAATKGIDLIIAHLTAHKDQTIAQIAESTGMSTNGVSSTISNYNRGRPEGERIMGMKLPGKASYVYWLESIGNRGFPQKSQDADQAQPKVAAATLFVPSLEQSSAHLAQYIAAQMRAEFDARLAAVLRPAIESGIAAMMSGVRSAMAEAFRLPESIVSQVVAVDDRAPTLAAEPVADKPATEPNTKTEKLRQLMDEAVAPLVPPASSTAPVVNILSTRTKHRDKSKPAVADVAATVVTAPGKRKVIICSLLPVQQELMRNEFGDCFDLRMFYRDQEKALTKAVNHGDLVILMGDFISHRVSQRIEGAGGKIELVMGGLTKLREKLTELYCDNKVAA